MTRPLSATGRLLAVSALALALAAAPASAQNNDFVYGGSGLAPLAELVLDGTTVTAFDRGWYSELRADYHNPLNENYIVGFRQQTYNNFFAFDLGNIGAVSNATLRLFTSQVVDADGLGNLVHFYDFVGNVDDLVGATGDLAGNYADLGSGTRYASRLYTESDEETFVDIALNGAAVADINGARGGTFAIGGTTAPVAVPETSTLFLLGAGLMGLVVVARRRQGLLSE